MSVTFALPSNHPLFSSSQHRNPSVISFLLFHIPLIPFYSALFCSVPFTHFFSPLPSLLFSTLLFSSHHSLTRPSSFPSSLPSSLPSIALTVIDYENDDDVDDDSSYWSAPQLLTSPDPGPNSSASNGN